MSGKFIVKYLHMRLSYFPNNFALNSAPVLAAFLDGVQKIGITPVENSQDADIAVIWSMLWAGRMKSNQQIWEHYRSQNKPVLVLEVGSLRRGVTWKLGLNGVNGQGYFGPTGQGPERSKILGISCKAWTDTGRDILICPQRSDSYQWAGMPAVESWLESVIQCIRNHSDRLIVVRPHPRERIKFSYPGIITQIPQKISGTYDDFDFDTTKTWAVINWNSGPGIQAILSGVPAFVGPGSLAAPVSNLDLAQIENPSRPDRDQWLNDLCYTEWTVEEIATGLPVARLLDH
jgi:hypothetical protein